MPALSAIILTLNEERNLGRCLESLRDIADEVIVVDSYSTDRTEGIAHEYGAVFIQHEFQGYIEQKNFALNQATHDHVLSLDADEAVSEELKASIMQVKERFDCDGYYMNRMANYCGQWIRHGGWYPDRKMRLFDRRKGSWRGTNPHDKFVLTNPGAAGYIRGDILHYTFYSIAEHKQQIKRFTEISAKAKFVQGVRSNWVKIMVKPLVRFIKEYLVKAGFMDGKYGWIIAVYSAKATYQKYLKLLRIQRSK